MAVDPDITNAINGIKGDIAQEAATTRGELTILHSRISTEKDERMKEAAKLDKEAAVRDVEQKAAVKAADEKAQTALNGQGKHTEWHEEQAKLQKTEKRQGRGTWVVIGIALVGWLVSLFKDCGPI